MGLIYFIYNFSLTASAVQQCAVSCHNTRQKQKPRLDKKKYEEFTKKKKISIQDEYEYENTNTNYE